MTKPGSRGKPHDQNMEPRGMLSWRAADAGRFRRVGKPGAKRPLMCLALAAAAVALAAGWRHASHGGTAVPPYETRPAGFGVVERTISATGAVKARVTVDVGSQVSGMIAEVKVNFNDEVKEGDLLAVIDRAPFEAKVASAAANLAIAQADIGLREAMVARAQKQRAQYERGAGRYRILAPTGSTSRMQLDQAETQSAVASEDHAIAQAQLASAKTTVALREAELSQAEIDLNHTLIRSRINGVVIDRRMQPGQTVAAEFQTPVLFQIAQDLSQILIFAQVDEADIGPVRPGSL